MMRHICLSVSIPHSCLWETAGQRFHTGLRNQRQLTLSFLQPVSVPLHNFGRFDQQLQTRRELSADARETAGKLKCEVRKAKKTQKKRSCWRVGPVRSQSDVVLRYIVWRCIISLRGDSWSTSGQMLEEQPQATFTSGDLTPSSCSMVSPAPSDKCRFPSASGDPPWRRENADVSFGVLF